MRMNSVYYFLLGCCALLPPGMLLYLTIPGLRQGPLSQALCLLLLLAALFALPVALSILAVALAEPSRWLQLLTATCALALDATMVASAVDILTSHPLASEYVQFGAGMLYVFWLILLGMLSAVIAVCSALISGWLQSRQQPRSREPRAVNLASPRAFDASGRRYPPLVALSNIKNRCRGLRSTGESAFSAAPCAGKRLAPHSPKYFC